MEERRRNQLLRTVVSLAQQIAHAGDVRGAALILAENGVPILQAIRILFGA